MGGYIMQNTQIVAQRIKERTKAKKCTIKKMLIDCELGVNTVSKMASGTDVLSQNLLKMATYLNCSVDYLLGRTDNPVVNVNANGNCINVDNNVQAVKNSGDITIRQITTGCGSGDLGEIEAMLDKLPRSEQLRAVADMMDLLEEKYSE
jgi:transcriptional regulator with XRE-family HTH domain